MAADPNTGMLVGETQVFPNGTHYGEYRIGGTSLSSPLMAGVIAIADDAAGFAHGFINPALDQLLGTRSLHDVRRSAIHSPRSGPTTPTASTTPRARSGRCGPPGYQRRSLPAPDTTT